MQPSPLYPDMPPTLVYPCATPVGTDESGMPLHFPAEEVHFVPDEARGKYRVVMPIQYKRLKCGHKLVPGSEPRFRNCELCWFSFFQLHGELTRLATEVFEEYGYEGLANMQGRKFAKNFTKFMGTLAHWKQMSEGSTEVKAVDEQRIEGTEDGGGEDWYRGDGNYAPADLDPVEG